MAAFVLQTLTVCIGLLQLHSFSYLIAEMAH